MKWTLLLDVNPKVLPDVQLNLKYIPKLILNPKYDTVRGTLKEITRRTTGARGYKF